MITRTSVRFVATVVSVVSSTSVRADAILEYDTGHPLGPRVLEVGVPTPLLISVRGTTGGPLPVSTVVFLFDNPDGNLSWDLLGPDGEEFTDDDGFVWESGFDEPPYVARVSDPPAAAVLGVGDLIEAPALGSLPLATLTITADTLGNATLRLEGGVIGWPLAIPPVIEEDSLAVTFMVVPEASTLVLLGAALASLLGRPSRWG